METIHIPSEAIKIISTSSKGDQSKWRIGNKWVKQNARGYEHQAEILASLILSCSTLKQDEYVTYYPCDIILTNGEKVLGCYSHDFRDIFQEVTLERLFESNFTSTDTILNDATLSTTEKFEQIIKQIENFTGLNVRLEISLILAFDALILNEDRHTNNILFLYNPLTAAWKIAPIFDNGLSLLSDTKDYPLGKPLSILKRKVKAKPFNTNFSKQLALYSGPPFIDSTLLAHKLKNSTVEFERAKQVLLSQMNDPQYKQLFFKGREISD